MLTRPSSHQNLSLKTNVFYKSHDILPIDRYGQKIELEFPGCPLRNVQPECNNPLTSIKSFVENKKTYVQNKINEMNMNPDNNFKNSLYLSEKKDNVNPKIKSMYQFSEIYANDTVGAGDKANYLAKIEYERQLEKEGKVHKFLKKTQDIVKVNTQIQKAKEEKEEKEHKETVLRTYQKIKGVINKWVGKAPDEDIEARFFMPESETLQRAALDDLKTETKDKVETLKNISDLREFMGTRSEEVQGKIQEAEDQKREVIKMYETKKLETKRRDQIKIQKYLDLKNLSQDWKIFDMEKLKENIRNDLVKVVLQDEERKNYKYLAKTNRKMTKKAKSIGNESKSTNSSPKKMPKTTKAAEEKVIKQNFFKNNEDNKKPKTIFENHKMMKNFTKMAVDTIIQKSSKSLRLRPESPRRLIKN